MRSVTAACKAIELACGELDEVISAFIAISTFDISHQVITQPHANPDLWIEFDGPDVRLLTANDNELLEAFRSLAAAVRRDEVFVSVKG